MGLAEKEFWEMSPVIYKSVCEGYLKRKTREWEHTRFIASFLYNANRGKNSAPLSPQELLPLTTDVVKSKKIVDLISYKNELIKDAKQKGFLK